MGQNRRFRSGQKAPNDGIYVEIGETGKYGERSANGKTNCWWKSFQITQIITASGHIKEKP